VRGRGKSDNRVREGIAVFAVDRLGPKGFAQKGTEGPENNFGRGLTDLGNLVYLQMARG
jgi:hypothetical protein